MPNEPRNIPPDHEKSNTVNPTARRNARRYALQAMYQWQISGTPMDDLETEFLLGCVPTP